MNSRTTLLLLVVCVALGLALYLLPETPQTSEDEASTPPEIAVLNHDSRQVTALEAVSASNQTLQVWRNGDNWDIQVGERVAGDTIVIGPTIANIAALRATSVITPETQTLADYGLDTPQLTIILQGDAGVLDRLRVGSRNPSGGARYVQVEGQAQIYLVNDVALDTLEGWYTTVPVAPTPLPTLVPTTAP